MMRMRWERPNQGLARGFGDGGHELAQVAHIFSAGGDDIGWVVYLTHEPGDPGEMFEPFASVEMAMAAAEAAVEPSSDEEVESR